MKQIASTGRMYLKNKKRYFAIGGTSAKIKAEYRLFLRERRT